MSARLRQIFAVLYGFFLLCAPALCIVQPASAEACPPLPAGKGSAAATFTVKSAGVYRLWGHVYASPSGTADFYAATDSSCPFDAGGTAAASAFTWIGSASGSSAPIMLNLNKGVHSITIAGQDTPAGVDQILLLASDTCVPAGDGSNCVGGIAAIIKPDAGQVGTSSSAVQGLVKLAAYAIAAIVVITLAVFVCVRLLKRSRLFKKGVQALPAPASNQPQQPQFQPPQQLSYGVTAAAAPVPAVQKRVIPLSYLRMVLYLLACAAIITGLVVVVTRLFSSKNVVISLADAKLSGQAQFAVNAGAMNGSMVRFGDGAIAAGSSSPGTAPAAGTAPQGSTSSGSAPGTTSGSKSSSGKSGTGSGPSVPSSGPAPVTIPGTLLKNVSCNYQDDTWSGDASGVGYSVSKLSASNGNPASFSVKLNAHSGTTEVVGYPSEQCLMYSALPANLSSTYAVAPPASSGGLDYEYAYDIWLTTAAAAKANNWNNDLELMIWNYTNGQRPAGSVKATLGDGSQVWVAGNNTSGTVSVVLPGNTTSGSVNIAGIVSQLESLGYVSSSYDGILDVEYGIEAPYGGGQTFTVNSMSLSD